MDGKGRKDLTATQFEFGIPQLQPAGASLQYWAITVVMKMVRRIVRNCVLRDDEEEGM